MPHTRSSSLGSMYLPSTPPQRTDPAHRLEVLRTRVDTLTNLYKTYQNIRQSIPDDKQDFVGAGGIDETGILRTHRGNQVRGFEKLMEGYDGIIKAIGQEAEDLKRKLKVEEGSRVGTKRG